MSSGTLEIGGTVTSLGFNSGILLTGQLTEVGAPASGQGDPLEFKFTVTGGDAASLYTASAPVSGIILSNSGFSGGFASDFNNLVSGNPGTGTGNADVAPVPLPAAAWLMISGIFGVLAASRRKAA